MQNEIVFYCSKCRSSMRLSYRLTGTPEREVLPGAVLKCGKCKRTTVNHINNILEYESDTAYGPLFQGYGICGGYSDLMELFLIRMGVKCYKISSENHVWNAVYVDGKWLHLDLTWDDPVANDGKQYLEYNYFLVDTSKLLYLESTQHTFNQNHYKEFKEA